MEGALKRERQEVLDLDTHRIPPQMETLLPMNDETITLQDSMEHPRKWNNK